MFISRVKGLLLVLPGVLNLLGGLPLKRANDMEFRCAETASSLSCANRIMSFACCSEC